MTKGLDYSDLPISAPEQDLFGVNPFAVSLARSLRKMASPQGVVIAINGAWGSGKSSAINLLKTELAGDEELKVVAFNPWWFRGEEALVLAFFRELYAATKPSLGERARKALPKLGARLLKAGGAVGPAVDIAGGGGIGSVASGTMSWLSDLIEQDESVEKLHAELSDALLHQGKRFVVLIDDIDRLSPDEALAMFRLVKSVGRLPNVIYVLAFDRLLAERVVQERYPSEGPHYLEKIVQAAFEVPAPEIKHMQEVLQTGIFEISGRPDDRHLVHVMNLFYEVVAPEIRTPRDVVRLLNTFAITWPAVEGNVDQGDFIALETYRVFQPAIYARVRTNAAILTGIAPSSFNKKQGAEQQLDETLLAGIDEKARYRSGLMRLFPKLESVWSNTFHSSDEVWAKDRRACSPEHFGTYFRLSPGANVLSYAEVTELLSAAKDQGELESLLLAASSQPGADGTSRVPLLLDALTLYAADVPMDQVPTVLAAVFGVADRIVVAADRGRPFEQGSTPLRLHWLIRALTRGRTTLEERSQLFMAAIPHAELGWLADFAFSAWQDFHPREGKEESSEEDCLVVRTAAEQLREDARRRIAASAIAGTLIDHPDLGSLLFRWLDTSADDGSEVRAWTESQLRDDHAVAQLARAFTGHSWIQSLGMFSLGDLVSKRVDRASIDGLDQLLEIDEFRRRVEEVAALNVDAPSDDAEAAKRFLNAWRKRDAGGNW